MLSALGDSAPCVSPARPTEVPAGPEGGAGQSAFPVHAHPILSPWVKSIPSQSEKTLAWPLAARSVARKC